MYHLYLDRLLYTYKVLMHEEFILYYSLASFIYLCTYLLLLVFATTICVFRKVDR